MSHAGMSQSISGFAQRARCAGGAIAFRPVMAVPLPFELKHSIDPDVVMDYITFMKPIVYWPSARKALRRMPVNTAKRIMGKIEAYAANPASQTANVKALKGRNGLRLRIGDWRVIMQDGEVLDILEIGPRGGIYD